MNCLHCGKEIKENASNEEKRTQWHEKCVRDFFGTKQLPYIDLTDQGLEELARQSVNHGFTVPGVQKKLSVHLSEEQYPRLTLVGYPAGYILKPQSSDYRCLPEFEYTAMKMAEDSGFPVVPFALLRNHEGGLMYITRRIDRIGTEKLAMEDFCQLSGRLTADKYKGSYERAGRIIQDHSVSTGLDLVRYFGEIVFSWCIGNSDQHLKNFSLRESNPGSRQFSLSALYDVLPVNIVLPSDLEETALTVNGKKKNLRRKDFLALASALGIPPRAAENTIRRVVANKPKWLRQIDRAFLPEEEKQKWRELIESRTKQIV